MTGLAPLTEVELDGTDLSYAALEALRELNRLQRTEMIHRRTSPRNHLDKFARLLESELEPWQQQNWRGLEPSKVDNLMQAAYAANLKPADTYNELFDETEKIIQLMRSAITDEQLSTAIAFIESLHSALLRNRNAYSDYRGPRHGSRR